jgi:hypothetical protein
VHNLLVPFAELPDSIKESNRATVRRIPQKLGAAGLIIAGQAQKTPVALTARDVERMAEVEHELWMKQRLATGITLGPESAQTNPYLVPWLDLPESIREIDRDLVRAIPALLAKAGLSLERTA